MWKFRDRDDEGNSKEEIVRKVKTLLEGLKDQIDVIRHIEAGIDVSRTSSSFDMVLYSEFDSAGDCQTYLEHPAHKKAGAYIGSVRTDRVVVDYTD
jgi:hypothetical protein